MSGKLKSFLLDDHLFFALLLLLVAAISFGLGKLSAQQQVTSQTQSSVEPAITLVSSDTGIVNDDLVYFVASKSGSKYHLPWCSGALRIKEENLIRFETKETAEAQGYAPAANCPEL